MGGWFPERLAVVIAILEVDEVDGLVDLLMAIHEFSTRAKNDG